jgi:chromate reductase, NAD(P)H dehydrogenase (quinone)
VTTARHGYFPKLLVSAIAWLGAIEAERRQSPEPHRPTYALTAIPTDAFGVDVAAFKMRVSIEINLKAAFLSTVLVRHASQAFDDAGEMRDGRTAAALEHLTMQLVAEPQWDAISGCPEVFGINEGTPPPLCRTAVGHVPMRRYPV